ncbi:hypothetical protein CLOM_g23343 [Closterium sp. NIES-68]|nr:hypothetical protein CLOM_g23343 [Closterium sp. NIES-68]
MASFPPPVDVSTLDHLVRAADNSATKWYSFVGSLHRVLGSAYVLPFRLLDIMLGLPEGDLGDPPPHPGDPPPSHSPSRRGTSAPMARRIGSRQIWLELEAIFERTDFDAVGPLFKEYFSITIEHSAGAVDYTSRLLDLASRLEARQTTLPPNLQIYRLLEGLSPQYEDVKTLPSFLPSHLQLSSSSSSVADPITPQELQQFRRFQQLQLLQQQQQWGSGGQAAVAAARAAAAASAWQQQQLGFGTAAMAATATPGPPGFPLWGSPSPSAPASHSSFLGELMRSSPTSTSMYPSVFNASDFQYPVLASLPSSPPLPPTVTSSTAPLAASFIASHFALALVSTSSAHPAPPHAT